MINKIIEKKDNNQELNYEELDYFFNGYLNNEISDEDMTLLLKSICKNDLSNKEIINLTDIFIKSGDQLDLSNLGITIDKHSTGGVGDKTTLILGPIVAACGLKMPKMSGRALGHTGGTIDKLESIGVNVNLTEEEFIKQVNEIGFAITSQIKNLCPMDKKVYALRDVTNTTESIGLIAASIMSKKIASGANKILIDLKVGKGALVKDIKSATRLANIMIEIGKNYNREVRCILTKMDNPLGNNIGNTIEIIEVIDMLQNKIHNNFYDLIIYMASEMISMVKNIKLDFAKKQVLEVLENGSAYNKFLEFVNYQSGNLNHLQLSKGIEVFSKKQGYIKSIDALEMGKICMKLGAGRINKEDSIDYNAGVILNKNVGDYIKKGTLLCTLYGKNIDIDINNYYRIVWFQIKQPNLIIKVIK